MAQASTKPEVEDDSDDLFQIPVEEAPVTAFTADLHVATIFMPSEHRCEQGAVISVQLRARNGLLLKTVARVVEVHDGKRPGQPAGMHLKLLDVRTQEPVAPRFGVASLRPAFSTSRSIRVLVVDDEPKLRAHASRLLRNAGHEVWEAGDGAQALAVAGRHDVAVILSAVNLPNMDGWQLLRLIRARTSGKRIGFCLLTTHTDDHERL